MGLRRYLQRSLASEVIPEGDPSDLDDNVALGLQMLNQPAFRQGMRLQIQPKTELPSQDQLSSLLKMAGFDPVEAERLRTQRADELRTIRQMMNITGQPQLDVAPAANYLQSLTGRDIGYKSPEPYDAQMGKQMKLGQMIGELEEKKLDDAKKLAELMSKLATKGVGMTLSKALPGQAAGGLRETDIHRDVKDLSKSLPKSAAHIEEILKDLQTEVGSFDPTDDSPLNKATRESKKGQTQLDRAADVLKYKMGITDRPLALFEKLIAFQLRDLTGLTATEYEQERARRIASFTALGSNSAKRAYIADTVSEIQNEIKTRMAGYSRPGVLETYAKQPNALLPEKLDKFLPKAKGQEPAQQKSAKEFFK